MFLRTARKKWWLGATRHQSPSSCYTRCSPREGRECYINLRPHLERQITRLPSRSACNQSCSPFRNLSLPHLEFDALIFLLFMTCRAVKLWAAKSELRAGEIRGQVNLNQTLGYNLHFNLGPPPPPPPSVSLASPSPAFAWVALKPNMKMIKREKSTSLSLSFLKSPFDFP